MRRFSMRIKEFTKCFLILLSLLVLFLACAPLAALPDDAKKDVGPSKKIDPSKRNDAEEIYRQGRELYSQGKLEEALSAYGRAASADPTYDAPLGSMGYIYSQMGKSQEALVQYIKAMSLNPDDDFYHGQCALVYNSLKEKDKALAELEKAITLAPENWVHYYNRGMIEKEGGDEASALKDIEKALSLCDERAYRKKMRELLKAMKAPVTKGEEKK
jgi:tetratricopeptide (TPR) repeat protein